MVGLLGWLWRGGGFLGVQSILDGMSGGREVGWKVGDCDWRGGGSTGRGWFPQCVLPR